ncbi:ankyrin repeat-containing domain protein [Talaromyces proteolyticus]|uniref:protein S-acyltransferase n=1 Tax=Talaromyces proteolyticus TaxID=1131652 RepID=A0AAD4KPD2_9EURO|nr:ankyrin repeat-containing domain protein [Talaromyces proteolyticus]KAH8695273.1 ankyrin repeat-containing domain protein [Talaromyces proteolyticus]
MGSLLRLPTELLLEIVSWILASKNRVDIIIKILHAFGLVHPRIWVLIERSLYALDVRYCGSSSLLWAATNGQKATALKALEFDASPNSVDNIYRSALSNAATAGHIEIVKLLLDHDADINLGNDLAQSPLFFAVIEGHKDVVELMLEKRPLFDLDRVDYTGRTPLFYAARWGWADIVDLLLSKGADRTVGDFKGSYVEGVAAEHGCIDVLQVIMTYDMSMLDNPNVANHTPLALATKNGHFDAVEMLVECGANMNARNATGRTPLILATLARHVEIAKCLVQAGADINATDNLDNAPLFYAIKLGIGELITLYSGRGAELAHGKYYWLVDAVSKSGYMNSLCWLLDLGPSGTCGYGSMVFYDALYAAIKYKQDDLVDRLLIGDCPVDPERPSEIDNPYFHLKTPLWLAVEQGNEKLVQRLLAKGANANVFINWGICTSRGRKVGILLTMAITKGKDTIIRSLIDYGAHFDLGDSAEINPLYRVVRKDNIDLVQHMLKSWSVPRGFTHKSKLLTEHMLRTLWMTVIAKGNLAMVRLLLEYGAELCMLCYFRRDASGHLRKIQYLPTAYALKKGAEEIAELLDTM